MYYVRRSTEANFTPFIAEIEQAAPPKRFSTPSFTPFKGDSDPESHLKHFKSVMILHKADDALMCGVFVITLREAAQDWFHTLPSGRSAALMSWLTSSPKSTPPTGRSRRIQTTCTTCAKSPTNPFEITSRDSKQKRPTSSDGFSNKNKDKRRPHPQGENYTKFTIPIHQILAQVKNKPWVRRPPPLKGDPDKRDINKYCAFHGTHGHTTNNCFAWKAHLEELVREGHCTEFVAKQAIQRIEERDTAKEPPQKVIRINTILADAKESGLTSKEKKRKIKQAAMISQVTTDLPPAEDDPVIGFRKKDLIGLDTPHNDALVISIQIAQAVVDRIHADEGSAANILQLAVIQQMGLETKINKSARSLTGFNGATTVTVGTIDLDVYSPPVVSLQTFMVINEVSPYNGILGRPWIGKINAITSATHQKIRYPIPGGGIGQINSDQVMARKRSAQGLKKSKQVQFLPVSQADLKEQSKRQDQAGEISPEVFPEEGWKPEEDVELILLDPDQPDKTARIGSRLSSDEKVELTTFLQNNRDMFAWSPSDMPGIDPNMPGIDPNIICHRLHVNPACKPVAQKRRTFAPERIAIIEAEIDKLLAAGFIEEVSYSEWLANVVLVAKQEKGKWRVCVDYTDLNKACPKDNFPLPRIDQLVDSTSGNQLLSFMDAYSGYNQILMHDDDKAKTSFIIERGTYCYKVMPFGLKNAGATYQRLVNKIFKEQIGKTMEVYVDDMLVKAPKRADHLKNLTEAFSLLRQYRMKLNPSKCTFGVSSGRFLGYLVTQRGIEAHPRQIKAILEMKSPSTVKEIQSLTGRAAALNRFLSRSTDKCKPFFKALKKGQRDKWDEECEAAFQSLKAYLTSPPLLSKPIPGEDLFVYLAVSNSAVSSALIREELGAQHPVFYTSKALLDAETRYPKLEKLILALVVSARKLRPYYQAHRVIVMTDFPLRSILHSPDASQRLMKWAIELSQYDLLYRPKTAIKVQILADFVVEFTPSAEEEKWVDKRKESSKADETSAKPSQPRDVWQLRVDGASNQKGAGAGVVIITPEGTLLEQAITLGFPASNNEAEYEALLAGLRLAKELAIKKLAIYSDSQLITNQASGEYMAKHPRMILYLDKVQELLKAFPTFTIQQVPRAENAHADALASLGSALDTQFRRSIPVEHLGRPSIEEVEPIDTMQIDEDPSWQDPIVDYLINGNLPTDKSEARKVQQKAARYYMHSNKLIRRSYSGPHLTCIKYPQTLEVLCQIHDGECGNHSGGRSLAQKALNIGYFWPTMRHDSAEYVKKCDRCQRYKPIPNLPAEVYHPQNNPWPFMQWAIDLVGPLPPAPAKKEMMIVATDYFTKWIEAEALSSTKEADVERFIWRNIICRFGCPQSLVTDNGSQFIGKQITAFFAKYKIKQHLSTPRYPQGNGQAEASNKVILDCLKKRLEGAEGKWVDELPGVLWAYRTTKRRSTGETPFSLAYGTEAIIPPHITVPSISLEVGSVDQNSEQMRLNLDLLEGEREKTIIRVASYQQQLKSYYDKRAKVRQFRPGDLVLRKAFITAPRQGSKKMNPNWEGPYVISRSGGRGSYTLDTMDGKQIPRQWNAHHLRKYFP
ncbi:unnamed protein product [Prunus brigantina]